MAEKREEWKDLDGTGLKAYHYMTDADIVNIEDKNNKINATNVEGALEEIVDKIDVLKEDIKKDEYATIPVQDYVTSLQNSVDGFMDLELEGNTLVNICKKFTHTSYESDKKRLILDYGSNASHRIKNLKPNTTYTFWNTANRNMALDLFIGTEWSRAVRGTIIVFTTKEGEYGFNPLCYESDGWTTENCLTTNYILLEGDYTNKPLPSYFEGIKSIDSLSIKSVGKNLFDITKLININNNNTDWRIDVPFSISNTNIVTSCNYPNEIYTKYLDSNKNIILDNGSALPLPLTSKDIRYIRIDFYMNKGWTPELIANLQYQLEIGTTATSYEPYKEDKIDILTSLTGDKSLKRLPNGVADTLDYNGVLTRRVVKTIFEGTENWFFDNTAPSAINTLLFSTHLFLVNASNRNKNAELVCDNFARNFIYDVDIEGIDYTATSNFLRLKILKSKLTQYGYIESNTSTYVSAFKLWLNANPTTVLYELAEPTTEQLQPLNLQSFKNGNLIIDTPIPPIGKIKYPVNIGGAVSSISSAVNNVENRTTKLEEGLFVTTAKTIELDAKYDELFQFANNGKQNWVDVIGSPLSNTDTFATLKSKTQTLKNTLATNLTDKGQSSTGTETLENLINKIVNINTGKKFKIDTTITDSNNYLIVNNLDFKPSFICMRDVLKANVKIIYCSMITPNSFLDIFNSTGELYIPLDSNNFVNENGFKVNTRLCNLGIEWIAIE